MIEEVAATPREFWYLFYPDWDVDEWLEDAFHEYVHANTVVSEKTKAEIFRFHRFVSYFDVAQYRDRPSDESVWWIWRAPVTPEHRRQAEKNIRAELAEFSDDCKSWLPIAEEAYLYSLEKYFRPDVTATERKMAEKYFYDMRDRLLSVKTV